MEAEPGDLKGKLERERLKEEKGERTYNSRKFFYKNERFGWKAGEEKNGTARGRERNQDRKAEDLKNSQTGKISEQLILTGTNFIREFDPGSG